MRINVIYNENCSVTLDRLPKKCIDGIITSPPYNINTERSDCYYNNGYSNIDGLSEAEYLKLRTEEFTKFSKVLKDKGGYLLQHFLLKRESHFTDTFGF